MEKPATAATFTMDEKKELHGLLLHLTYGGVHIKHVAEATGINYKSFINKFGSLTSEVSRFECNNRNRFTKADYDAIMEWWSVYREKMYTVNLGV